jgi:hypothetical protein
MGIISNTAQCLADLNQCSKDYQMVANVILGAALLSAWKAASMIVNWRAEKEGYEPPKPKRKEPGKSTEPSGMI